jgi:hypothetical protein
MMDATTWMSPEEKQRTRVEANMSTRERKRHRQRVATEKNEYKARKRILQMQDTGETAQEKMTEDDKLWSGYKKLRRKVNTRREKLQQLKTKKFLQQMQQEEEKITREKKQKEFIKRAYLQEQKKGNKLNVFEDVDLDDPEQVEKAVKEMREKV